MPNLGTLAKSLMDKMIVAAGDGAVDVSVILLESVTYTPDGDFTRTDITVPLGKALKGNVSEAQVAKYGLTSTSHAFLISTKAWEAAGARDPDTYDSAIIGGVKWRIEKIVYGSFGESYLIFACLAGVAVV